MNTHHKPHQAILCQDSARHWAGTGVAKPMACDTFMCKLISSKQSKLMKYSGRAAWLKLRSNASESGSAQPPTLIDELKVSMQNKTAWNEITACSSSVFCVGKTARLSPRTTSLWGKTGSDADLLSVLTWELELCWLQYFVTQTTKITQKRTALFLFHISA